MEVMWVGTTRCNRVSDWMDGLGRVVVMLVSGLQGCHARFGGEVDDAS